MYNFDYVVHNGCDWFRSMDVLHKHVRVERGQAGEEPKILVRGLEGLRGPASVEHVFKHLS